MTWKANVRKRSARTVGIGTHCDACHLPFAPSKLSRHHVWKDGSPGNPPPVVAVLCRLCHRKADDQLIPFHCEDCGTRGKGVLRHRRVCSAYKARRRAEQDAYLANFASPPVSPPRVMPRTRPTEGFSEGESARLVRVSKASTSPGSHAYNFLLGAPPRRNPSSSWSYPTPLAGFASFGPLSHPIEVFVKRPWRYLWPGCVVLGILVVLWYLVVHGFLVQGGIGHEQ